MKPHTVERDLALFKRVWKQRHALDLGKFDDWLYTQTLTLAQQKAAEKRGGKKR